MTMSLEKNISMSHIAQQPVVSLNVHALLLGGKFDDYDLMILEVRGIYLSMFFFHVRVFC